MNSAVYQGGKAFKVAISASLMYFFALELFFFADVSTLSCFHRVEKENNSIFAEIALLGAIFPDLILTVRLPVPGLVQFRVT